VAASVSAVPSAKFVILFPLQLIEGVVVSTEKTEVPAELATVRTSVELAIGCTFTLRVKLKNPTTPAPVVVCVNSIALGEATLMPQVLVDVGKLVVSA
jgi:hypothetical protein